MRIPKFLTMKMHYILHLYAVGTYLFTNSYMMKE